ncbi:MAG: hypothetical protein Q4P15_03295 [Propionibacteriaceae bacterium]|nr:hypothetical protein [Propionibacteriaceae bacterium]
MTSEVVPPQDERDAAEDRLHAAEALAANLDRPMGYLGLIFLFVVLGQLLVTEPRWVLVLNVTGWVFWSVFVAEFLLRAYIARFQVRFWKRNWWQVIFLLVPFLRFFRALQALRLVRLARLSRLARAGGILSAGVRGSRSAGRVLSSRIGTLVAVTMVVILASSQLLYAFETEASYGIILYETALATITGSGFSTETVLSRFVHVALATYSVAVFATLAGTLGAFFLRGQFPTSPAIRSGAVIAAEGGDQP